MRKLVELLSTAVKNHAGERPFKALQQSRMRRVIIQNYLIKPHEHAARQLCNGDQILASNQNLDYNVLRCTRQFSMISHQQ